MIYGRLSRRLRALGMKEFNQYCQEIKKDSSKEILEFTNAITTNLTSFFREFHHFEYLENEVIPRLMRLNRDSRRIRVWSAGCSTGEEPYSIAMVFSQFAELRNWDVKILATDLDSNVVATAKAGVYRTDRTEKVPSPYEKYLESGADKEQLKISSKVSSLITFKQLNLLHTWPMKGQFDIIFCRNVVIYFDLETQKMLFDRYANVLKNDSHLFIGHSESLNKVTNRFSLVGRTIYKKLA
jgi:chemotaxis protein methyltransferase CheR